MEHTEEWRPPPEIAHINPPDYWSFNNRPGKRFLSLSMVDRCIETSRLAQHDRSINNNSSDDHPDSPPVARLALRNKTKWTGNGVRLCVAFIDVPPPSVALQHEIVMFMNLWSKFCNVRFTLLHSDDPSTDRIAAEVRISFSGEVLGKPKGGTWSYVGTRIIEVTDRRRPTMMLEGLDRTDVLSKESIRTTIIHETGHILGFVHEHSRHGLNERIDKKKAYAHYWRHQEWTASEVDNNLLTRLKDNEAYTLSDKEDSNSIMCYRIDESILNDGMKDPEIKGGDTFSWNDQKFAGLFYPIPEYEARVMTKDRAIAWIAASGKALYLLMKDGQIKEHVEMNGHRKEHIIGETDVAKTTLTASDDKLYMIRNKSVVSIWRGSPGDDTDEWSLLNETLADNITQVHLRGESHYYRDTMGTVMMYKDDERHWRELHKSADTEWISSTKFHLYRQNNKGEIYQTQVPQGNEKHTWRRIDKFDDTVQIAANWRHLYQQRRNGEVWVYTGVDRYWMRVFQSQDLELFRIEAYEDRLFRINEHPDRGCESGVWVNDDNTEGGWKPLNIGESWSSFVYTGGYVYAFVEGTGEVTRYTGIC
ncbi:hypothetical protein PQX77_014106 [Marasmius sp. AFHP31]|nr:hypothetical protein PQX77_014106 [Marasmius sp. AFHP31]